MLSPELEVLAVREVTVKYKTVQKLPTPIRVAKSIEIFALFRDRMNAERVETFQTILVNSKNQVMAIDTVSRGGLSECSVHPREVMTTPVRLQAAAILFMHNHPSGDPAPSPEDQACTARLVQAGSILGIRVLDHIIFGTDTYYSFADNGTLGEETKEVA